MAGDDLHDQAVALYEALVDRAGEAGRAAISLTALANAAFGEGAIPDRERLQRLWRYLEELGCVEQAGSRIKVPLRHPDEVRVVAEQGGQAAMIDEISDAVDEVRRRLRSAVANLVALRNRVDEAILEVERRQRAHNFAVRELEAYWEKHEGTPLGDWIAELVGEELWYYELEDLFPEEEGGDGGDGADDGADDEAEPDEPAL